MDFQAIRKEYENAGIDESSLPANPMELFRLWYELAVEKSPGRWFEPNAMALATSDGSGGVTNRIVLLKHVEEKGIQFFTNYDSKKGSQLAVNANCSLVFHWPYLGRQIRIEGIASQTSREVSEKYFHSRPRGSQLGAIASKQSAQVESREELEACRAELETRFEGNEIPLPDNWGGYYVRPSVVEFWQGRLDRLHDRIVFRFEDDEWACARLSP